MRVVLAGGTGSLGRRIADDLARKSAGRGHDVVILTRSPRPDLGHRQVRWDGRTVGDWASELSGAALVNLAGELVNRRPTAANIALLTRSRVEPTRALVDAATTLDEPLQVWLQMSTLAIYGDAGDTVLDESAAPADGPPQMAGVATAWEAAAAGAPAGRRVVLRTGVVLDPGSPALDYLARLVRWGLGGRIGTGRQWVSWLHRDDMLAIVRHCLDSAEMSGVVHATSPHPVRNAELMATLRGVLHRPPAPPAPPFAVRLGAAALKGDPTLALTGRRGVPAALLAGGFRFGYDHLRPALEDLLGRR